jgi:hypothetical protein
MAVQPRRLGAPTADAYYHTRKRGAGLCDQSADRADYWGSRRGWIVVRR